MIRAAIDGAMLAIGGVVVVRGLGLILFGSLGRGTLTLAIGAAAVLVSWNSLRRYVERDRARGR